MLCKEFFYISIHIHPVRLVFVLSLEIAGRFHPDCQYIDPRTLVKVVIVTPCLFPSPMEYFVLSCCRVRSQRSIDIVSLLLDWVERYCIEADRLRIDVQCRL